MPGPPTNGVDEELPDLVLPVEARDHCRGRPGARYSLVEYGDYESRGCAEVRTIVGELERELGDDLCFAFRNFPQAEVHPHAMRAAEVAEGADLQAKFWLMHERLFEHQDELSEELYRRLARELPLEMDTFERDLSSGTPGHRIAEDLETGREAGVVEAPTFFVNGRMHVGSYEFLPLLDALRRTP